MFDVFPASLLARTHSLSTVSAASYVFSVLNLQFLTIASHRFG